MDQKSPLATSREASIEKVVDLCLAAGSLSEQSDKYFTHTSRIVAAQGEVEATFAIFMRRRVIAAFEPAVRLVQRLVPAAKIRLKIIQHQWISSEYLPGLFSADPRARAPGARRRRA